MLRVIGPVVMSLNGYLLKGTPFILLMFVVGPTTWTGEAQRVAVLLPKVPDALEPQDQIEPSDLRAKEVPIPLI